jgi:CheY-like chemotaxis protein
VPINQLQIKPRAAAPSGGHSLRILIIEDNRDGAESMAVLLRAVGHQAYIAFNGPDGLVAADESQPDVVLLDIGLPGMDGYEVSRRLRDRHGDGLIILAVSGYCQTTDRERSKAAGVDQHLAKPVNLESLLKFLGMAKRGP